MKEILLVCLFAIGLGGCLPESAPKQKPCGEFVYEEICGRKDHCQWADGSCKAK